MNFFVKKFFLSILLVLSFTLSIPSAFAIEYSGIGGRPAFPDPSNPRTNDIFIETITPGTVKQEGVKVINNTKQPRTLIVYSTDFVPSSGGGFACKQYAEPKEEVGKWIDMEKQDIILPPMSSEVVFFAISVPKDAEIGEYNGCIAIQDKLPSGENGKGGVSLATRTALRVAITIPGDALRKLEIVGFSTKPLNGGGVILFPQVKNLGNVSVDSDVEVKIIDIFGQVVKTDGGKYPVLAHDTSEWNFELPAPFWGGFFSSTLKVSYDASQQAQIGVNTKTPPVILDGGSISFFMMPSLYGMITEILIMLFVALNVFLFWISKRRKQWIEKYWTMYTVQTGEDLYHLSEKFDVSWKLLAKANNLTPPYVLNKGDKIKVPPKSNTKGSKK